MSEHTPGPWAIDGYCMARVMVADNGGWRVIAEPNQRTFIDPETGEVIEKPRTERVRTADFPGLDDKGDDFEYDEQPVFDQTPAGQAGPAL